MDKVKQALSKLLAVIRYLFSYIYDITVTYPLTRSIYKHFAKEFASKFAGKKITMIDVGTGTGTPLKSILKDVQFERVLAVDINRGYLQKARENFAQHPNVEVRYLDFMEAHKEIKEKFDIVFFGFSFMLMPDREEALKIAKKLLKPNGKIYMFLTLYHKKSPIVEWIKPRMKYIFSVEYGPVMYYNQVIELLLS